MKPVLITGATGFLGKQLVELLRPTTPLRLFARGLSGDVTNHSDVDRDVQGAAAIYHLAGMVSRNPADAEKMHQVHVEGTRNILEAALKHGVERVVLASTSGVIAVSRSPSVHTEDAPYSEAAVKHWPYYLSKIAEEKLALDFHRRHQLPIVVINPSLLLGPGDDRKSSTGDVIAILEGQALSYQTGGLNFVDVRDAAAAAIAAMQKGRPGERYLLGGPNWTGKEFTRQVCRLAGLRPPLLTSPTALSLLSAPLLRKLMPLIGRKFDLDDITLEMSGVFWFCDSSKAARELDFHPRDPMATLRDTIDYIRSHP